MVCIACIIIPIFLWVFFKFISPWLSHISSTPDEMARNIENHLTCPLPKRMKNRTSEQLDGECSSESNSELSHGDGHSSQGELIQAEQ